MVFCGRADGRLIFVRDLLRVTIAPQPPTPQPTSLLTLHLSSPTNTLSTWRRLSPVPRLTPAHLASHARSHHPREVKPRVSPHLTTQAINCFANSFFVGSSLTILRVNRHTHTLRTLRGKFSAMLEVRVLQCASKGVWEVFARVGSESTHMCG